MWVYGCFIFGDLMRPSDVFETVDIWEASFLRAHGAILAGKRKNGDRVVFLFGDRPTCERLALTFMNNAAVPIGSLKTAYRDLKRVVFEDAPHSPRTE